MALPLFLPAKHHVTLELVQGTRTGGSGGGGAGELCGSGAGDEHGARPSLSSPQ